jgi:hypothetical protein
MGGKHDERKGQSQYESPITITADQSSGLDYSRNLTEQTVRIRNSSTNTKNVTIQKLVSQLPPSSDYPQLAGEVPLFYFRPTIYSNQLISWHQLTAPFTKALLPGEEWTLQLEARRALMTSPAGSDPKALYQSLLEVTDGASLRSLLPVTATGNARFDTSGVSINSRAGLWIGRATITHVSEPGSTNPLSVGSPFQFRLIVHVDGSVLDFVNWTGEKA